MQYISNIQIYLRSSVIKRKALFCLTSANVKYFLDIMKALQHWETRGQYH